MEDRNQTQWEVLGAEDPYWAVLTNPAKKGGRWDKDAFFQTGMKEVEEALEKVHAWGININYGNALDFGCGVGRLSRALATYFRGVVALDISQSMLAEARRANRDFPNIAFVHNTNPALETVEDESVDFIFSTLTLQHIPARNQQVIIRAFCRALKPGGVMVFYALSKPKWRTMRGLVHLLLGNRPFNAVKRWVSGRKDVMEVHTVAESKVRRLLGQREVTVINIERYDREGDAFVGSRYYAVKR